MEIYMKKKIIIILIILIILASLIIGAYYIYVKYKEQDPFELEWVRIYYNYMKTNNEALKERQKTLKYYRENEKIQFCEIENIEKPVMLYNYEELGQTFTKIIYIDSNNMVNTLQLFKKDLEVEYLYNIEENNYYYYIHETYENEEKYSKISESINANKINEGQKEDNAINEIDISDVIKLKINGTTLVTTLEGKMLEISDFDKVFIKTNLVEDSWSYINLNSYEDEIKREFSIAVKKMKNVLDEDKEEEIIKKESEIEVKKQEIINAVKEIEEKQKAEEDRIKAEEEARIRAEEEAKKAEEERIKAEEEAKKEQRRQEEAAGIENYTLRCGTYKGIDCWSVEDPLSKYEVTIVLREDGTYTQTNLITVAQMTETYSGTYTIIKDQTLGNIIKFSANDAYYQITENDQFTSRAGAVIKYEGN